MIDTKNQATVHSSSLKVKYSHVFTKTFSGFQRQLSLLRFIILFVVTFILLTLLLSLVHSSCLSQVPISKEHSKTRNKAPNGNYKFGNSISNKTTAIVFSAEEMNDIRMQLLDRKAELERQCQNVGKGDSNLDNVLSNMIIDTMHGISWCPIYKVASSTWMKHFATLGGVLTETAMELIRKQTLQINTIVRQAFPRDPDIKRAYQKLNQTKKFLIVRHPFERLVSAYRDKLEHIGGREYYYKRFGRHITHKYQRYRQLNETSVEPTFVEFLRFIVEEKYFDEHWAPFVDTCEPCLIRYDYILKFDSIDRDQRFLIQELDLWQYLYQKRDLKNVNPRGITSSVIVKEYMRNVPRALLDDIIRVYKKDFILFSYLPV